jgi:hypothetical protein
VSDENDDFALQTTPTWKKSRLSVKVIYYLTKIGAFHFGRTKPNLCDVSRVSSAPNAEVASQFTKAMADTGRAN